jgi:hypothetical protein
MSGGTEGRALTKFTVDNSHREDMGPKGPQIALINEEAEEGQASSCCKCSEW